MTFEELKQEFIDNGFQIDGDIFTQERVVDGNMVINGVRQKQRVTLRLQYVGEGEVITKEGESEPDDVRTIYQFDVLNENNENTLTLCLNTFDDLNYLI